jgi:heme/copper-type cytochrome/quinol oxidase subunit 3
MGRVVELRTPALEHERQRVVTHSVGMVVALGSWGMMFAALLFVYFGLRAQALAWPPPGLGPLPLALPTASTVAIVLSSVTLHRGMRELRAGRLGLTHAGPPLAWIGATVLFGLAFVGLQLLLWRTLSQQGITTATGSLGAVLYGLTVLHALHVGFGLVALGYLLLSSLCSMGGRGAGGLRQKLSSLHACAMFWHFVDAVWVVMFVSLFLL